MHCLTKTSHFFIEVFRMYGSGFKNMRLGRVLWCVILLKLLVLFLIIKPFFMANYLNSRFATEQEKADYVMQELTQRNYSR